MCMYLADAHITDAHAAAARREHPGRAAPARVVAPKENGCHCR